MATYKLLKLKNYIYHLILGTFFVLFGLSILQSIVSEMADEYKPYARIAYIAGAAACLAILIFAIFTIYRAFHFEKLLMRKLTANQKILLTDELEHHVQMIVKGQAIMTTHFLIVPMRPFGPYKLLVKEDIIACFKTERHQESKAINGRLRIFTKKFKSTVVFIAGKGSALVEQEMFNRMIKTMPWIIHENYEDFLLKSKSKGMRKILVSEVEDDRAEYVQADPATYAPDDTLSLSGTSIPIIGQTIEDDEVKAEDAGNEKEPLELAADTAEKDASISKVLTQKLSSAGSVINHFMPKAKRGDVEHSKMIADMFEEIDEGHNEKTEQLDPLEDTMPIADDFTEPIIEPVTEPLIEPVTEPIIDSATEPIVSQTKDDVLASAAVKKTKRPKKKSEAQTAATNEKRPVHSSKKKHTDPDATVVLTRDQQEAISSFEKLIMNSSKNRSSDKYQKS